jgi:hypothetical protein
MQMFQHYTDWLFGPDVWGKASLGVDGQPVATPALKHVLIYDYAIRQRVADNMNSGTGIKMAFAEATADIDTRLTHFFGNVQLDIGSAACRAISAPGLSAPKSTSKGNSGQPTKAIDNNNDDDKAARNKAKRLRNKANKAQKAAAASKGNVAPPVKKAGKVKALQNGGVGDGSKGAGKNAGKNAGKPKLLDTTAEGEMICFKWNFSKDCVDGAACTKKHVCRICLGAHRFLECPKRQGA